MNRSLSVCPLSAPHMAFLAGCNSINSHQLSPPPLFSCWTCQVMFCGSYVWLRPPSRVWERVEVGSMGRDGPVWTGDWDWTSLSWETITSPPPPPTPTLISPLSVYRHSFVSLSCFNTLSLPSQSWGTAYPFIYLCIRRRKWTPTQGRRVKVRWTVRAYGCEVVCVCVCAQYSIYLIQYYLEYLRYPVRPLVLLRCLKGNSGIFKHGPYVYIFRHVSDSYLLKVLELVQ